MLHHTEGKLTLEYSLGNRLEGSYGGNLDSEPRALEVRGGYSLPLLASYSP